MTTTQNIFSIVGVGPGDPHLMTIKAVQVLSDADTLVVPKARENGQSTALNIVKAHVDLTGKEIIEVCFPMHKVHNGGENNEEVTGAWNKAAEIIREKLQSGKVAFPTLGDPALYSTGFYVHATLLEHDPDMHIELIPGITAMSNCSAVTATPLCLGGELLSVIPATFTNDRLEQVLAGFDTIVLMKVHRVMGRLVELLDRLNLLSRAVLVEKCGQPDQRIFTDIRQAAAEDIHYFSTIIVRKKS